ncbi:hypothetical protein WJX73_006937 [Symbiochloris irregularis]|uniref:Uncharacterized protein n=1 Tax=Symbiochloris irregularis TaxID=706552 RepID=A0AAW1P2W5_9CHLO
MTSQLPTIQSLTANKLLVGGKLTSAAAHSGSNKPKSRGYQKPHHAFWLGISHVVTQHRCLASLQASSAVLDEAPSSPAAPLSLTAVLIVGPGVLGAYLGKLWAEEHPEAVVVGQTNTSKNHSRLQALGIRPRLKEGAGRERFPNVVFCAPPSGCDDYEAEVKAALKLWDGSGTFLFTSSAGLYTAEDGSACSEDSPVQHMGNSERTDRLLKAESAVLGAGGCVLRLAGLYHADRGPHTFFLKQGTVQRWPGYLVNLIHYEDAARLCHAVLQHSGCDEPFQKRVFLGTDGSPLTFQTMIDATVASGCYEGSAELVGPEGGSKGKQLSNAATREALGWEPKYSSFEAFMSQGAQDFYKSSSLF